MVRSRPPAQAEKPADQPLTEALNGPMLAPYHGMKSAMNATAAPTMITRSSVSMRFQSNSMLSTSRTSA